MRDEPFAFYLKCGRINDSAAMHFHQIMVGYVVLFQFRFMCGIVGFFLRFEEGMGVLIVDWPKLPECLGGTQNAGDIL